MVWQKSLDRFLNMFSKLPQVSIPVDFPPRDNAELIITGNGSLPNCSRLPVTEFNSINDFENQIVSFSHNHNHTLLPMLEILIFDGHNPRLWIRQGQKFFQFYKVPEN